MDEGIVWRIPAQDMRLTYISNPKAYHCPTYFYDGTDPYPKNYMHGAGYFLPWWSLPCIYQQNFQVFKIQMLPTSLRVPIKFLSMFWQ